MSAAPTATTYDPIVWEADGYATGRTWSYRYLPGGPWIHGGLPEAGRARGAWFAGFLRAIAERGIVL